MARFSTWEEESRKWRIVHPVGCSRRAKVNVLSSTGSIAWVVHYNGDRNIAGPGASDRGWQATLYKPDLLDCCTADLTRLGETQRRYYRSLDVAEQDILLWLESNYETSHDRGPLGP